MLSCEDLTVYVNQRPLFEALSFTALPSSILYLKGYNGIGKTSLLQTLAGIRLITKGEICLNELSIKYQPSPFALYIGHHLGIKLELTVIEQLLFWSKAFCSTAMIKSAIHYWGLEEILDSKIYALSTGNRKKVALSKLTACLADLWLLDEVETNLDECNLKLLRNAILAKAHAGGIIIISTHLHDYIPYSQVLNLGDFTHD